MYDDDDVLTWYETYRRAGFWKRRKMDLWTAVFVLALAVFMLMLFLVDGIRNLAARVRRLWA